MSGNTLLSRLVFLGSALAITSCAETPTQPTLPIVTASAAATKVGTDEDDHGGTALFFNGADAITRTPKGTIVTTQIDDISYDAMVRFDGPNSLGEGQAIFYNGHSGVTGWGVLVLGASDGVAEGTLAILAGGITVAFTPLMLTAGTWQHVQAERRAGNVTLTLDDQTFDVGFITVNPLAGVAFAAIEFTSVGGAGDFDAPNGFFHGAIDKVRIRDLANNKWIERWNLNEKNGTTATGVNGSVLFLGNTLWASRGQGN